MSQKKSQLLSFAHDEDEEAEHLPLPKLKMKQSARPLSFGESEAKRAKASPALSSLSSLSAVSGGSYGSDALEALRKAQNYLPSKPLGAEEAREERVNISSSRELCAASLREGMELSGDAADTFEQILIDREKKEGKHADEALLLDKKKSRSAQKAVSFADIFAPTKRETMREAVGAQLDIDEDWEKEILRRGSSLSSSLAPPQSGGNHTRTDDSENYIEVRDLLETIQTNQFVEKEKVLQLQRQANRLESELVISQDNERRLELALSSGVERLNIIENLANYVPNLIGMLREKEKEIVVLREELIQLVQSMTERVHQQRRTQQEHMLSRIIQVSELVGIGEYRPTRSLHGVGVESFHANDAESELFAIQERQIQLEKNAEEFLRRRWLKLDKDEPNQHASSVGGVLHLSMDEERQVVLFAKQRLDVFCRCCEREKNIFALFVEQEIRLSSAPMSESFRTLNEKLNNLFMDVDQNLCEPSALFTFSASLRSSQRDVYDAAFISTSLAQLCEVFLAKDALFIITSRLQGLSEPLGLQIENEMPWLSAMCDFEKDEMTEKRVSPKIVENIFATLFRQLFSIGLLDFYLPGLARDLCALCEKTKKLMSLTEEKPFSSGILASFVSQCEMYCFAVCKTLPVKEDNIERESHDVGLGHSFMFSQCLRGCLFLSSLLILSPCVESIEATRVVERLFQERFGGMVLKLLKSNVKESQFMAVLFCALVAKITEIECSSHTWKKFCFILHGYPLVDDNIAEITDFEPLKKFSSLLAVDELVAAIEPILRS